MNWLAAYAKKFRGGKRVPTKAATREVLWSAIGGVLGILAVYEIGKFETLPVLDSSFLIGSFGASAILLYGAPSSPFAQPRNVVVGHTLSAIVGVSCALLFSEFPAIAAALAVSVSLAIMLATNCVHPPGGATALTAVIGGEQIHAMQYWYVISPILIGVLTMLVVALLVNNLSRHRRYPEFW